MEAWILIILVAMIFGLIDIYYFNIALKQLEWPWSYKEVWWWILPGAGILACLKSRKK